jgi:cytochrome c-type biogenesis protein CcmH/NrfG
MLNGRLEKIESPTEKGRRLLDEAVAIDPSHEEAQLYLAFLHGQEGRRVTAAEEYKQIFNTAVSDSNRAHAAIQLGRLYFAENGHKKAIACWRWVTISGLADADDRFFFVRFNLGMAYATLGNRGRALSYFRQMLDRHPNRVAEVADLFARPPEAACRDRCPTGVPRRAGSDLVPSSSRPRLAGRQGRSRASGRLRTIVMNFEKQADRWTSAGIRRALRVSLADCCSWPRLSPKTGP